MTSVLSSSGNGDDDWRNAAKVCRWQRAFA
jgi:hypothetical protein